jgi:hypothetical protein
LLPGISYQRKSVPAGEILARLAKVPCISVLLVSLGGALDCGGMAARRIA